MSYILNGKYYKGTANLRREHQSTYKSHEHARQRKDFSREIVQPFKKDGSVNPDFIEAYPIESKEVYKFGENNG